jgi:hypothetical protein
MFLLAESLTASVALRMYGVDGNASQHTSAPNCPTNPDLATDPCPMSARDTSKGSANRSYTPRGLQRVGASLPPHLNGLVSACPWASQAGASCLPRAARRSAQRPPVKVSASLKTSGILIRVRAECEWTMMDWQAAMDEIKTRGCWVLGVGASITATASARAIQNSVSVCLGGEEIARVFSDPQSGVSEGNPTHT